MINKDYYVYLHIRKDNGTPFYVGKGRGNRLIEKKSRSEFWNNVVNKYGYDIILLENDISEEKSFEMESYWIKRIGRRDLELGPLVNLSDGGEGNSGHKWTEEQKKQVSIDRKGRKPWNTGKKCPQLSGEKNAMFGKTGELNPMFGKGYLISGEKNPNYGISNHQRWVEKYGVEVANQKQKESNRKMSENNAKNASKKVIDLSTNKIYDSLRDAAKYNSINYSTLRNWLNPNNKSPNKSNLRWL